MNPFGRLGTGDIHVYEYTPGPTPQVAFRRLVERNGAPVTDAKVERQERRPQTGRSIEDVVNTLRFTIDRREHRDGRDTIVVQFEPRPNADPQTRQGRVAKVLKGTIWIDEASREVMRMEGTAMEDVSYGLGIVARINKGAALTVTRERVDGDVWLPTSVRMKGNGRALLVRKMSIDYFLEWFDYKRPNP
jgi:hypothetical protein